MAPIRFSGSSSKAELIAWRHEIDTGGAVTGNAGLAFVICAASDVWVLPSNGRYIAVRCCSLEKIDTAYLVVDTFVE